MDMHEKAELAIVRTDAMVAGQIGVLGVAAICAELKRAGHLDQSAAARINTLLGLAIGESNMSTASRIHLARQIGEQFAAVGLRP